MRFRGRLLVSLVAVAAIATACGDDGGGGGSGDGAAAITIVTEWSWPDPLWIPFLVADDQGLYADAGLDVTIQAPPDNSTTMKMLSTGDAQVGLSAITDVVFARAEGLPVVAVGNMTTRNNWGLFALGGDPIDVGALAGKTIGIYDDSWTAAMLPLMLGSAGLTIDEVNTYPFREQWYREGLQTFEPLEKL